MMRNLKALGVALAAVLALSALAASAASADTFKSEGGQEVTLTGSQEASPNQMIFKTTSGSVTCPTSTFHAKTTSGVSTVTTSEPVFAGGCLCIGIACTVSTNGCDFLLHITTTEGTADLVCPAGKELTLTSAKCVVHIKPQGPLPGLTYSNTGSGATREVTIKFDVTNIHYEHTKVGEGIGSCTSGTSTTGSLTGSAIVTAEKPGTATHVGIFVE